MTGRTIFGLCLRVRAGWRHAQISLRNTHNTTQHNTTQTHAQAEATSPPAPCQTSKPPGTRHHDGCLSEPLSRRFKYVPQVKKFKFLSASDRGLRVRPGPGSRTGSVVQYQVSWQISKRSCCFQVKTLKSESSGRDLL